MVRQSTVRGSRVLGCLFLFFFVLGILGLGIELFIEVPGHLALGWTAYLWRTLPEVRVSFEPLLTGLAALVLAVWLGHRFTQWFIGSTGENVPKWPFRSTIAATALLLILFAAAVAMTGIVHQSGWLFREDIVESSQRFRPESSAPMRAWVALQDIKYESNEGDVFPNRIDRPSPEAIGLPPTREGDQWIYLAAGKPMDLADEELVLVYPKPIDGKWLCIRADGEPVKLDSLAEALEQVSP